MRQFFNIADDYRIYNVSVTSTATTLRALIIAAVAGANLKGVIEVKISGDADLTLTDIVTGDTLTITSGTTHVIPSEKIIDEFQLSTATTANGTIQVFRAD